jgi:hypothetical protein
MMPVEVRRRFRRAMRGKVGGAGGVDEFQFAQPPGDQAGIGERPYAQRAIDAVLHQVHRAVTHAEFDVDVRIGSQKFGQGRRHDQSAHAPRQIGADAPGWRCAGLAEQPLGLLEIGEQVLRAGVKRFAIGGQRDAPCRPVEQARAKPGLKLLNGGRHRGAWQAERVRGVRETAGLRHARKDTEEIDAIHCSPILANNARITSFILQFPQVSPRHASRMSTFDVGEQYDGPFDQG